MLNFLTQKRAFKILNLGILAWGNASKLLTKWSFRITDNLLIWKDWYFQVSQYHYILFTQVIKCSEPTFTVLGYRGKKSVWETGCSWIFPAKNPKMFPATYASECSWRLRRLKFFLRSQIFAWRLRRPEFFLRGVTPRKDLFFLPKCEKILNGYNDQYNFSAIKCKFE